MLGVSLSDAYMNLNTSRAVSRLTMMRAFSPSLSMGAIPGASPQAGMRRASGPRNHHTSSDLARCARLV